MSVDNYKAKCYVIVGGTGSGKTTTARKIANVEIKKGKTPIIYDVNNEYTEVSEKFKTFDYKEFVKILKNGRNKVGILEEATVFANNRSFDKDLLQILVAKRHHNNSIIFVYHSLRSIPVMIADLANIIIVKKTNDNPAVIETKFKGYDEIIEAFEKCKESTNQYEQIAIELNP